MYICVCVYVSIFRVVSHVVVCRDIREAFIRAKYETKAWVPRSGGSAETLSKALCVSAATDNVQRSYELICGGANVSGEETSRCGGRGLCEWGGRGVEGRGLCGGEGLV